MNNPDWLRIQQIGDEMESLADTGDLSLAHFRRLYTQAVQAARGNGWVLEMFSSYMPDQAYFDEAKRISDEMQAA
jgi:hypothetical protein